MSRKGESIFKRKDGRYEGRYVKEYKNGKAVYGYVYAKTYNECKRRKNNIILDLNEKKIVVKRDNNYKDLNFYVNKWLESKTNIKESTYTKYHDIIENYIKDDIGKEKINKLNSDIVNNYLKQKLERGKKAYCGGLSRNTVYSICTILKQVFKENNIDIKMIQIKQTIGVGRSFNKEEKTIFENQLVKTNTFISTGIMLSLLLGLRRSEVCGIKYSDIDINTKLLSINQIVSRVISKDTKNKTKLVITSPKSEKSKRKLPIPEKLINELTKLKNTHNDNDYLLTGKEKYIDPRTFYNHYKKFLKVINLDYTYHDLRHTFASNCIEIGIDSKSLMELLGHSNVTTTMNVYVHPSINSKRSFINQL